MKEKACFILLLLGLSLFTQARADCTEDNWDIWKVSKALSQGLSKTDLLAHLDASRAELSAERMENIRGLIDEVYLLDQSQAEAWWKAHYKTCAKEDEA